MRLLRGYPFVSFAGEETILQAVRRARRELAELQYRSVRDIVHSYRQAEAAILHELKGLTAQIEADDIAGMPRNEDLAYRQGRLDILLREVDGQIAKFSASAINFSLTLSRASLKLGREHANAFLSASVSGGWRGLHKGAFEEMMAALVKGSPLHDLFEGMARGTTEAVRGTFASGLAKGYSPRKIASEISQTIEIPRQRALVIARTESLRAYRGAHQQSYESNSDVVAAWRWTATPSTRTCPLCLALDGSIHPTSEILQSHPCCRCVMVPVAVPAWQLGQPIVWKSGETWFSEQTDEVQNHILGRTKAELYRGGKIRLIDNVRITDEGRWGKSVSPKTISRLRQERALGVLPSQTNRAPFGLVFEN